MNPRKAETCNRVLTENNGLILSPGYPESYPASLDCSFKIVVEESSLKLALFFSKFELESSANCANDYLQIDNQPKICGSELPDPFFKNLNQIDIRFHTNDNLGGNNLSGVKRFSVGKNNERPQRRNMSIHIHLINT